MSELKYNIPVEVTKEQYDRLKVEASGIIAHRQENGRYWIKLLLPKYKQYVRL